MAGVKRKAPEADPRELLESRDRSTVLRVKYSILYDGVYDPCVKHLLLHRSELASDPEAIGTPVDVDWPVVPLVTWSPLISDLSVWLSCANGVDKFTLGVDSWVFDLETLEAEWRTALLERLRAVIASAGVVSVVMGYLTLDDGYKMM